MEFDGYDEHGNITPAMVTIVMLHNYITLVWHRLDANLEMNSYNQLGKGCQASGFLCKRLSS